MRPAKQFPSIDHAQNGRERCVPALNGRLVRSAKNYERVQVCRELRRSQLRGLDARLRASNDGCCRRERFIFDG